MVVFDSGSAETTVHDDQLQRHPTASFSGAVDDLQGELQADLKGSLRNASGIADEYISRASSGQPSNAPSEGPFEDAPKYNPACGKPQPKRDRIREWFRHYAWRLFRGLSPKISSCPDSPNFVPEDFTPPDFWPPNEATRHRDPARGYDDYVRDITLVPATNGRAEDYVIKGAFDTQARYNMINPKLIESEFGSSVDIKQSRDPILSGSVTGQKIRCSRYVDLRWSLREPVRVANDEILNTRHYWSRFFLPDNGLRHHDAIIGLDTMNHYKAKFPAAPLAPQAESPTGAERAAKQAKRNELRDKAVRDIREREKKTATPTGIGAASSTNPTISSSAAAASSNA